MCENTVVAQKLIVEELTGRHVRLEPLRIDHVGDLIEASGVNRSTYEYTPVPDGETATTDYVLALLRDWEAGAVVPFAQVQPTTGRAMGVTRYMTFRTLPDERLPYAVEIGGTWIGDAAQRTGLNTEAKYLLLRHAFQSWDVARVDLKTDARNERSRRAIVRIGATFEGVLRQWQPSLVSGEEGQFRDTAMFSVVESEWPAVQHHLLSLLH